MNCVASCPTCAIESASTPMEPEAILKIVLRDTAFYGNDGGLTLSGGEPLFHGDECLQLLQLAKEAGLHTAVETCGHFDERLTPALVPLTDLLLWDFKDSDDARHKAYTGVSNATILRNLHSADALGAMIRLRCIMARGVNMEDAHYRAIAETAKALKGCAGVQLLPYHAYGGAKNTQLGFVNNARKEWIPLAEDIRAAEALLREQDVSVIPASI